MEWIELIKEKDTLGVPVKTVINLVRFQVLTAASMNIRALWDVAPCSLGVD
jgi:hypothetical protein